MLALRLPAKSVLLRLPVVESVLLRLARAGRFVEEPPVSVDAVDLGGVPSSTPRKKVRAEPRPLSCTSPCMQGEAGQRID